VPPIEFASALDPPGQLFPAASAARPCRATHKASSSSRSCCLPALRSTLHCESPLRPQPLHGSGVIAPPTLHRTALPRQPLAGSPLRAAPAAPLHSYKLQRRRRQRAPLPPTSSAQLSSRTPFHVPAHLHSAPSPHAPSLALAARLRCIPLDCRVWAVTSKEPWTARTLQAAESRC
jgi:hypothetical protein